jgi:hypothetical protein
MMEPLSSPEKMSTKTQKMSRTSHFGAFKYQKYPLIIMEFVNLKVRPALRDRLKVIAAKEKVPMTELVERWIREYEVNEMIHPPKSPEELLRIAQEKQNQRNGVQG